MNLNQPIKLKKYLLPFSWLYGLVVYFRNKLFDCGILKQKKYDIPVICVGNITVGGTGKTPHTELLVKILLENNHRVGVISRGYKRKSKGFVLSTIESTSREIGDEPYQIKQKYPKVILAVDSNRRRGIDKLLELVDPPQVIIMDDGFQHRYVKPSFSIILSNFNRPIYEDKLLPVGLLRDTTKCLHKAGMVIITKCSDSMQPIDYRIITHDIDLLPYQSLFFTSFSYKNIIPVFGNVRDSKKLEFLEKKHILLVTGIASPEMIISELGKYTRQVTTLTYNDHYIFSKKDIKHIQNTFEYIGTGNKLILVTEKDAARLVLSKHISDELKSVIYCLPIEVKFAGDRNENDFKEIIYKHVRENTRNG